MRPQAPPLSGTDIQPRPSNGTVGLTTGYSIVLPPGWRKIPIRHGTKAAIRNISEQAFARLPRHVSPDQAAPYRIRIEQRLTEMTRNARQAGGVDLYLPTEPVHGTVVPASFIVSCGTLPALRSIDNAQVISRLIAETEETGRVTIDGIAGVRSERTTDADARNGLLIGTLRVDYILPLPDHPGWWLIITFSTPGDGNPHGEFAKLLAQLFDSIMLTFRWTSDTVRDEQYGNGAE